jgi:regulator of protease activity HflC (stomatin/prohibitin superfamily)
MDTALAFLVSMVLGVGGYFAGSAKVIEQGSRALVERFGRYQRTLDPGLNFVIPFIDSLVVETVRERTTDIKKQQVITSDGLNITVDVIVYWQIVDLARAYYAVENLEDSLANLVLTEVRAQFGQVNLADTFSRIDDLSRTLLERMDEVTATWGIKVQRVNIQSIERPPEIDQAIEREKQAESERRASLLRAEGERDAAIAESEGRKRAAIAEAEGIVQAMQLVSAAMQNNETNNREALQRVVQFLLAQRYVDANQKISESPNSKVIFMDPRAMNEALGELMREEDPTAHATGPRSMPPPSMPSGGSNGNGEGPAA